jgi:hypothetical protein
VGDNPTVLLARRTAQAAHDLAAAGDVDALHAMRARHTLREADARLAEIMAISGAWLNVAGAYPLEIATRNLRAALAAHDARRRTVSRRSHAND